MTLEAPIDPPATRPRRGRVVVAVAALGLAGFAFGYLGSWPPVATVMSGSMSPTIKTGDVVVLKRLRGEPHVGDIIAVSVPDEARSHFGYPPEVIHRVVSIAPDGSITTKGDAKPRPDPFTVPRSSVNTKVVATIPAAGRVMAFLMSPMGLLWLVGGAVLLIGMPIVERRREAEQEEHDVLAEMREELRTVSRELALLRAEPAPVEPEPEPAVEPEPLAWPPAIDWVDLETTPDPPAIEPEPDWPEPAPFLPDYVPVGRERERDAAEVWLEPVEPSDLQPEPVTYVTRRRSGGLLGRLL